MIRVSAYPTVEWLRNRACDRQAILPMPVRRRSLPSAASRLTARLRDVLNDRTTIERNVWISTPEGEVEVQVVLKNGSKRLAICFSSPYSRLSDLSDALVLVYGRFEALYRVKSDGSEAALDDSLYALMCERPSWFSNYGRLSIGRLASEQAIFHAGQEECSQTMLLLTGRVQLTRMRLCKANDWVDAFEKALDVQHRFQKI